MISKTKGGFNTKIHMICTDENNPVIFSLSSGNALDVFLLVMTGSILFFFSLSFSLLFLILYLVLTGPSNANFGVTCLYLLEFYNFLFYNEFVVGRCVGMVDKTDSKSVTGNCVWVQVPPSAPVESTLKIEE